MATLATRVILTIVCYLLNWVISGQFAAYFHSQNRVNSGSRLKKYYDFNRSILPEMMRGNGIFFADKREFKVYHSDGEQEISGRSGGTAIILPGKNISL